MISESDGKNLISLARKSIILEFENKTPDLDYYNDYNEKRGVFVTLKRDDKLRGCIGFPIPLYPLNEAVIKAAVSAAFSDPRFTPVQKDELDKIKIELSVLTLPKELAVKEKKEYLNKIEIGKDGLIVRNPFTSGLLLPQVANEWNWSPLEFLENTCLKAGLSKDAWKEDDVSIYTFQAQIFEEK